MNLIIFHHIATDSITLAHASSSFDQVLSHPIQSPRLPWQPFLIVEHSVTTNKLNKMVGNVKCCKVWGSVFEIDEVDHILLLDNHIGQQGIVVAEDNIILF